MAWKKPSAELEAKFEAICPKSEPVTRRLMFGFPAAFVNGNLFAGLHEDTLILRLADAARHELLKLPGARVFEPTPDRPMREYVVTPPLVLDDDAALRRWVKRALEYVSALPTRPVKPTKPRAQAAKPARAAKPRARAAKTKV